MPRNRTKPLGSIIGRAVAKWGVETKLKGLFMRDILFRAKAINREERREYRTTYKNGDWVYGLISQPYNDMFPKLPMEFRNTNGIVGIDVDYKTVGQYTGLTDKNGKKIFEGDIVKFFGRAGKVCFEQGCFGIGVQETIDWKKIKKQILPLTGCDNKPYFCENDNFVSFWELIWNFNGEDEQCDICKVIGNIYDNPELLEKDNV